jgi:hypothetical protein
MGLVDELLALDPETVETTIRTAHRDNQAVHNFAGLTAIEHAIVTEFVEESRQAGVGADTSELAIMFSTGVNKALTTLAEVAETLDQKEQSQGQDR